MFFSQLWGPRCLSSTPWSQTALVGNKRPLLATNGHERAAATLGVRTTKKTPENHEKTPENDETKHRETIDKPRHNHGETTSTRKPQKNQRKTVDKPRPNHEKTTTKPRAGKTMNKNMEKWDTGKPTQHRRNTEEISRAGHKTEGTPKEHRRNQAAL